MKFEIIHLTGAEGFIGTYVKKTLVARGYKLICYDYNVASRETVLPSSLFANVNDLRSKKQIILHLGAVASTSRDKEHLLQARNVDFTENLAVIALKARAPIMFISSAAVYGVDMSVSRSLEPKNSYGCSKLTNEQSLAQVYKERKSDLLILRLFNVYGEGEIRKGEMMSIPSRFILDALKFNKVQIWKNKTIKNQSRDFIHVKDVVEIIEALIDKHPWYENCIDVGTGSSVGFDYIAEVLSGFSAIDTEFVEFPSHIDFRNYQYYTKAKTEDLFKLIGYFEFKKIEDCLLSMWNYYANILRAKT